MSQILRVFLRGEMKCLITNQRDTALTIRIHHITTKCFGKLQNKFGICRPKCLEISQAGGAIF